MDKKQLTAINGDAKEVEQLYRTAFPKEEQVPWELLLRLTTNVPLDFTVYYDNGLLVGFTVVYRHDSYNWFWYFAVNESLRGKGYGQEILSEIVSKYGNRKLILDMESPEQSASNSRQRKRRLEFYTRNGFRDTHTHKTFDGIEYTIMMHGEGDFTAADYDSIINDLRRYWNNDD